MSREAVGMARSWGSDAREEYYYESDIDERIESAYERAYQAQVEREAALWERRRSIDHNGNTPRC